MCRPNDSLGSGFGRLESSGGGYPEARDVFQHYEVNDPRFQDFGQRRINALM